MSKPDDNNPFRSGNTAALDLDQLEKEGADNWNPWNKQRNQERSPWASDDWGGGKSDWPEEFGGSGGGGGGGGNGGTAALDISDFDAEAFEKDQSSRRVNKDGNDWGDVEDFFGGGVGGGTAALDLSGFQSEEAQEDEVFQKKRAERTEDARDPHTHNDQRGRLTYEGGQGDPHKEDGQASRGSGRNRMGDARAKERVDEGRMEALADDGPLLPQERTMAIGLDEIRNQAPPPREGSGLRKAASDISEDELSRTEALDIEEIRKGISRGVPMPEPADLFPEESTVAINMPELGSTPPTTDFPAPTASNPAAFKTSMLDKAELEKHRLNEVASGAKLMILVPGNDPVPFDLRPGITNVGRERTNHLVLADPYCSRKHLRVKKYQGSFEARDIGSDNGTLLNGVAMRHNQDMVLGHGDELRIGSTTMRFILGRPGPEDYAPPRFDQSITASKPAIPRYTDQVDAIAGPPTSRVQVPPTGQRGGGMSMATIVILVALVLGILALVAAVLVFVVFSGTKESALLLPLLSGSAAV